MGPFINLPFTAASFKQGLPIEKICLNVYTAQRHMQPDAHSDQLSDCPAENHFSPGNKAGSDMCGLWHVHWSTFQSPYGKVTNRNTFLNRDENIYILVVL